MLEYFVVTIQKVSLSLNRGFPNKPLLTYLRYGITLDRLTPPRALSDS